MEEDRCRDVVGHIPRHEVRPARGLAEVHVEDIVLDDRHALVARVPFAQEHREIAVDFYRDHAFRPRNELLRERAAPRPDFHHGVVLRDREDVRDTAENARIRQEVLAEPLPRLGITQGWFTVGSWLVRGWFVVGSRLIYERNTTSA